MPGAVVTTIAGGVGGTNAAFSDGEGSNAGFNLPHGLVVDAAGTIILADSNNHLIRKITPVGGTCASARLQIGNASIGPWAASSAASTERSAACKICCLSTFDLYCGCECPLNVSVSVCGCVSVFVCVCLCHRISLCMSAYVYVYVCVCVRQMLVCACMRLHALACVCVTRCVTVSSLLVRVVIFSHA
jgi:hypothetical protein